MTKKSKKVLRYLSVSGVMYLYCILFSLFSLVFLSDAIPKAVVVIFGFIFWIPVLLIIFVTGRSTGEKDFKVNATEQSDKNSNVYKAVKMNYVEIVYYLVSFAVPLIILTILGAIIKNVFIHAVPFFVFMPVSLIFTTLKVVTVDPITALSIAVYIPAILITCAAFVLGYLQRVAKLVRSRREIASELRMFNN